MHLVNFQEYHSILQHILGDMESLGLYPLSVILSFLSETEGVSLLITHKRYASQLLPLFRLRSSDAGLTIVVEGRTQCPRHRHRFVVSPAQAPTVLLERLNTRRLCKRRRLKLDGHTTVELAQKEWEDQSHCASIPAELELLRFFDKSTDSSVWPKEGAPTLLVSYPRSGNTLVRNLLERTTATVTGSDTRPDRSLSKELAEQHGLAGEGVTTQAIFVKTHWPERTGNRVFTGRRAILLVRNPYDAIDSYWNLNATKSHTKTVTAAVYEQFIDQWRGLVRNEIQVWIRFLDYWIRKCPAPVLIVRFEDLIRDPSSQLTRMIEFALSVEELSDFWKERVRYATSSSSTEKLGSYRPRTASKGIASIGKSIRKGHYSAELLEYIHQTTNSHPVNYMRAFGYDIQEQGFPANFVEGREPCIAKLNHSALQSTSNVVRVNAGEAVRPTDCPYGRLMQKWRHLVTDNDTIPLPTE